MGHAGGWPCYEAGLVNDKKASHRRPRAFFKARGVRYLFPSNASAASGAGSGGANPRLVCSACELGGVGVTLGLGTFSARTRRIYRLRPNLLSKEAACRLPSDDKCGNMWRRQTVQSPNAGHHCLGPRGITNAFRPRHKVSLPECQSSSPSTVIKPSCSPVH
jgi:hypothetical protein